MKCCETSWVSVSTKRYILVTRVFATTRLIASTRTFNNYFISFRWQNWTVLQFADAVFTSGSGAGEVYEQACAWVCLSVGTKRQQRVEKLSGKMSGKSRHLHLDIFRNGFEKSFMTSKLINDLHCLCNGMLNNPSHIVSEQEKARGKSVWKI